MIGFFDSVDDIDEQILELIEELHDNSQIEIRNAGSDDLNERLREELSVLRMRRLEIAE